MAGWGEGRKNGKREEGKSVTRKREKRKMENE